MNKEQHSFHVACDIPTCCSLYYSCSIKKKKEAWVLAAWGLAASKHLRFKPTRGCKTTAKIFFNGLRSCYFFALNALIASFDTASPSYHHDFTRPKAALNYTKHLKVYFHCTCAQATVMICPALTAKEARTHCCKLLFLSI